MSGNVFTVPPGAPFLSAIAAAILRGDLPSPNGRAPEPLDLPDITLLLPTRRAARAAQEAFLAQSGHNALLMPRIRPISESEEDTSLIAALAAGDTGALDLPGAVTPMTRTLVLMQLISRWRAQMAGSSADPEYEHETTPAQAANLAVELAKLMDDVERENVSLAGLSNIVPDDYSEHWQKTVEFLKIITEFWPTYLEASGLTSPAARRNAAILAEAKRISELPENVPVIVAGVTGSIPATTRLMQAVAARKNGAVVLPALDQHLDDESWARIVPDHPEHPQFGLKKLIDALGITRGAIRPLPGIRTSAEKAARAAFVAEAMRPSATTGKWHGYTAAADRAAISAALREVSLIEAPSAQDEAEAIALILREAVDTPGRTAALVSPDRLLARRVAIRLESFGIRVDDSAGRPFAKTVPGTFLALVIDAMVGDFSPAAVMALLKHPLLRVGLDAFDVRRYGRALEIAAFRAPYLGRGLDGVAAALEKSEESRLAGERLHTAAKRLWDEDRTGAADIVARLQTAFAPLVSLYASDAEGTLKDFVRAHAAVAEALAALPASDGETESNPLWQGEAGEAASTYVAALLEADSPDIAIHAADYADLYRSLLARENIRERTPVHPRVTIWGPYEARLQQPDVIVLGSLNEGTWPEAAEPGAWLNRPMRRALGLPAPEEETGRAAHDFVSLMGADTVYLTRATKVQGVPTVPSRWLMRIGALLDGLDLRTSLVPDQPWLAWARSRDAVHSDKRVRLAAPEPRPPVEQRPRRLSVTAIETWISNPYAIFARHILKLEQLPELGASPDQSLRGGLVHEVLARFATTYPSELPSDIQTELNRVAREVLESYTGHPRVAAFWMPRLERFLSWFAQTEDARRGGKRVFSETSGSLVLDAPAGPFTLTARADRIDDDGSDIIITDYKTGSLPQPSWVKSGRAPQLPLEAAIALGESSFPSLQGRGLAGLRFIRASGGEPAGEEKNIDSDLPALAASARAGLESLVADFDNATTPYRAIRRPRYRYDYDAYAHLARVAEWSAHVDEELLP